MEAIKRLNGLKTWAAENLDHAETSNMLHDLDAVIEVVEKLNKVVEMRDDLIVSLNMAGAFIESNIPNLCGCGGVNTSKVNTMNEIREVLAKAREAITVCT